MVELLDTVIGRWEYLLWIITGAATLALGVFIASIKFGGLNNLKSWVISFEEERRFEARSRITEGLDQLIARSSNPEACDKLISGLDQWRDCKNRTRKRITRIKRLPIAISILFFTFVMTLILRLFEPQHHRWSAVGACLNLIFLVWFLYESIPLIWQLFHNGPPPRKMDSNSTDTKEKIN